MRLRFNIIILILFFLSGPVIAQEKENKDNEAAKESAPMLFSMGLGVSGAIYDVTSQKQDSFKKGYGLGIGLILEKSITPRFGFYTGIWHSEYYMDIIIGDGGPEEAKIVGWIVTLPLYLATAFSSGRFTLNILTGFNFAYLSKGKIYINTDKGWTSVDVLKYTNYGQSGFGGGIELKFRLTRFVDLFIGIIGERYLSNYLNDDSDEMKGCLYNLKVQSGAMLRSF